ncbi:glutathione S-transferase [Chytriomyces sp. MP71]|nr:glutathione S-transferase [Chytriomyces sp. MP71]
MAATLYYTSTSCGASNYIAAFRAGILGTKLHAYQADIRNKKVLTGPNTGHDFFKINPKGNVPTIVLEDGKVLNENAATLQWIADHAVNPVGPKAGSNDRYLLQSKLSWVSSELHSSVGGLFNPTIAPEVRTFLTEKSHTKLKYLNDVELADGRAFLVGDYFTVVDSYLYVVLTWSPYLKLDLSAYPNITKYFEGIKALPFVQEAHEAMTKESPAVAAH